MTALVALVTAFRISLGRIFGGFRSTSTRTGVAPKATTTLAVAGKVMVGKGRKIQPGPIPAVAVKKLWAVQGLGNIQREMGMTVQVAPE